MTASFGSDEESCIAAADDDDEVDFASIQNLMSLLSAYVFLLNLQLNNQ